MQRLEMTPPASPGKNRRRTDDGTKAAGTTIERRYRMYGIRVYEHEVPSTKAQLAIREHEHGAPLAEHEELEIWMPVSLDPTAKKVAKCSRKRTTGKLPVPWA